jgi:hypothetical protein
MRVSRSRFPGEFQGLFREAFFYRKKPAAHSRVSGNPCFAFFSGSPLSRGRADEKASDSIFKQPLLLPLSPCGRGCRAALAAKRVLAWAKPKRLRFGAAWRGRCPFDTPDPSPGSPSLRSAIHPLPQGERGRKQPTLRRPCCLRRGRAGLLFAPRTRGERSAGRRLYIENRAPADTARPVDGGTRADRRSTAVSSLRLRSALTGVRPPEACRLRAPRGRVLVPNGRSSEAPGS